MIEFTPKTEAEELSAYDTSIIGCPASRTDRAELYTLGAMMLRLEHAEDGCGLLSAEDFRLGVHQVVFRAIKNILAQKRIPDAPAVFEEIKAAGKFDDFHGGNGPAELLGNALTFCVTGIDFEYQSRLVKDLASKRIQMRVIREYLRDLRKTDSLDFDPTIEWTRYPAHDIAARYAKQLSDIANDSFSEDFITMRQSTLVASARIDEYHRPIEPGKMTTRGVKTSIRPVDDIIPSFEPGELAVIAARPGVGKSAFAALFARNVAIDGGKVLFFSLEMPHEQQTIRMLSMTSMVPMPALRGKRAMTEDEKDSTFEKNSQLAMLPIIYRDKRGVTSEQIASEIRTASRKYGKLSLIVVDYLQLLRPENVRDTRNNQIGYACKVLRNAASEAGCPILCLAQLNREVEGRSDLPRLSDLRDSGEIEQDADIVAFLHVDPTTKHLPVQDVTFVVAKQRNGETVNARLAYHRAITMFSEPVVTM